MPQFVGDLTAGVHPFPSRTRKLSPAGPMVLHAKVCGRVGRCRHKIKASHGNMIGLFLLDLSVAPAPSPAAFQSSSLGFANLQAHEVLVGVGFSHL